jgi:hypothetical protein
MVTELDDTLPRFMDVQWDSVQATLTRRGFHMEDGNRAR